jgi:hypothetical protein
VSHACKLTLVRPRDERTLVPQGRLYISPNFYVGEYHMCVQDHTLATRAHNTMTCRISSKRMITRSICAHNGPLAGAANNYFSSRQQRERERERERESEGERTLVPIV